MANLRLLALTHLIAAGAGFAVAPRELLAEEVENTGFFQVQTSRVLSATVESLRSENKLLVFSYKGLAAVAVERDGFLLMDGSQSLTIAGRVGYFLDLTQFGSNNIVYDDRAKLLTINLPPLVTSDIAWDVVSARTENSGLLTFSQHEVDELHKRSLAAATRALTKQTQGAELVRAAKVQAVKAVERFFTLPLRLAGHSDVTVVARFDEP